jgi:hypothetical protein
MMYSDILKFARYPSHNLSPNSETNLLLTQSMASTVENRGGDDDSEDRDMIHATTYAGAKQWIAALEQQLQDLTEAGAKRKRYIIILSPVHIIIQVWHIQTSDLDAPCHGRDLTSNITQGCIIPCLVSMFQSIDELVDENDHRCALEVDESSSDNPLSHSPE